MSTWIKKNKYNYHPRNAYRHFNQYQQASENKNNDNSCYFGYNQHHRYYPKKQAQPLWSNNNYYYDKSFQTENENPQYNNSSNYYHNSQSQRYNNYYYNDGTEGDYLNKNRNGSQFTQTKHYNNYQDDNVKNNNERPAQVNKKILLKNKKKEMNKKSVNADNSNDYNRNCIDQSGLFKGILPREEVLRVKIQLKGKLKEIVVYKSEDPFQVAKNFVETNNLQLHLIHPLALNLTLAIATINEILTANLTQEDIALLNILKSITKQTD